MLKFDQYKHKASRKKFVRLLEQVRHDKPVLSSDEICELLLVFEAAFELLDDCSLECLLSVFATCKASSSIIAPLLLSALLWRPVESDYYDAKEWRQEVTDSLYELLNIKAVISKLKRSENTQTLAAKTQELFLQPLEFLEPVLKNKVSEKDYIPKMSDTLITLVRDLDQITASEFDEEVLLTMIKQQEKNIEALKRVVSENETFHSLMALEEIVAELNEGAL